MAACLAWAVRSRWVPPLLLAGLVSLAFVPLGGFGIPMCAMRDVVGLPCPGCGLTRSFIHLAHGDPRGAAVMNPFGLLLFPIAAGIALMTFAPAQIRRAVAGWAEQRERAFNIGGILLGCALGVYGFARILWLLWSGQPSIW